MATATTAELKLQYEASITNPVHVISLADLPTQPNARGGDPQQDMELQIDPNNKRSKHGADEIDK